MPICEMASIMLLSTGVSGKIKWRISGMSAPNTEGPRTTPTRLSEDGRLPEAAHPFPKHAANEEEDQLGGKNCHGVLRCQGPLTLFQLAR